MKHRILIIGARSVTDIIRAGKLVAAYEAEGYDQRIPSGRHHGVVYGPADTTSMDAHAYVWHTANQITVRLGIGDEP
mgnify:CR=1 FL=1